MTTNEVCFSPPGPGQCFPERPPHQVDEPGVFVLLLVAGVVAWLVKRK